MQLHEIFVQLPEPLQVALENALEKSTLPTNPTRGEVFSSAALIVGNLIHSYPEEATPEVVTLLGHVPTAVVDLLFQ